MFDERVSQFLATLVGEFQQTLEDLWLAAGEVRGFTKIVVQVIKFGFSDFSHQRFTGLASRTGLVRDDAIDIVWQHQCPSSASDRLEFPLAKVVVEDLMGAFRIGFASQQIVDIKAIDWVGWKFGTDNACDGWQDIDGHGCGILHTPCGDVGGPLSEHWYPCATFVDGPLAFAKWSGGSCMIPVGEPRPVVAGEYDQRVFF